MSMEDTMHLAVYVPTPESPLRSVIRLGSGIVGSPEGARVRIDYEGALYGQSGLERYADRVRLAAGRHTERYPTIARAWVEPNELIQVGWWDEADGRVVPEDVPGDPLAAWLRHPVAADELLATGAQWGR